MTFKQAVYIPISGKTRETRVPDQESHWVPTLETFFFPRLEVKRWYTVLISYRRNSKSLEAFEYQHCPISSQLKHVFSRRILAFEIFPPYTANCSFTRHSWHDIHFTKPLGTFFAWRIHFKRLQINPLYSAEYISPTLTVHLQSITHAWVNVSRSSAEKENSAGCLLFYARGHDWSLQLFKDLQYPLLFIKKVNSTAESKCVTWINYQASEVGAYVACRAHPCHVVRVALTQVTAARGSVTDRSPTSSTVAAMGRKGRLDSETLWRNVWLEHSGPLGQQPSS